MVDRGRGGVLKVPQVVLRGEGKKTEERARDQRFE